MMRTSGITAMPRSILQVLSSPLVHPINYLPPSFSLSLIVGTQIRGHIAGSSPAVPATVRALHFYRENISALSSLVS